MPCWLAAGEAVVVPQGWWHYAVALDRSVTVQRNFYHAHSNAAGLVEIVVKAAAALRQQAGAESGRGLGRQPPQKIFG